MTLSIEVLIPTPNILMMGGGHCAKAMSSTFDDLDWNYSISDSREDFCNSELFPNAKNHYNATVDTFFDQVSASELKKYSDVLLLGHDWSEDEHRLLELLNICQSNTFLPNGKQFPRIGVIGSRSKWQAFSKKALNHGISQQLLDDVICPIGLNIGAHSPEEIAVAVAGQILSLQRNVSQATKLGETESYLNTRSLKYCSSSTDSIISSNAKCDNFFSYFPISGYHLLAISFTVETSTIL